MVISPTPELVSRHGLIQMGRQVRVGPITRTVEDAARIIEVISGYDVGDPLTAFSVGRLPDMASNTFTQEGRLDGMRIGVVQEYMDRKLLSTVDQESIAIVERGIAQLHDLGATLVELGEGGDLFTQCIRQLAPEVLNNLYVQEFPERFPPGASGPGDPGDQISTLLDMSFDWEKLRGSFTLRDLGEIPRHGWVDTGEIRYAMNKYLRERGDANIRTMTDRCTKANFFEDPHFRNWRQPLMNQNKPWVLDTAFPGRVKAAIQEIILQAMADLQLDTMVYPTTTGPPRKLGAPGELGLNGRMGVWTFLGRQGFPAMTVPAGFTTCVHDRIPDPEVSPSTSGSGPVPIIQVGPTAARLPVGMDTSGRPFSEPTLLRIAAAFESATHHRKPPADFGPLPQP